MTKTPPGACWDIRSADRQCDRQSRRGSGESGVKIDSTHARTFSLPTSPRFTHNAETFPGPAGKRTEEIDRMGKPMSKSDLISKLAEENDGKLSRKDVKGVLESLATIGYKELKKTGIFLVPGFAKFVVIKKPATKERKGINPFTKEPTVFKAKPARKIVRARPVKAAKDAV